MRDCERRVLGLNLGRSAARLARPWFFELLRGSYEDVVCILPSCLKIRLWARISAFPRKENPGSHTQSLQELIRKKTCLWPSKSQ